MRRLLRPCLRGVRAAGRHSRRGGGFGVVPAVVQRQAWPKRAAGPLLLGARPLSLLLLILLFLLLLLILLFVLLLLLRYKAGASDGSRPTTCYGQGQRRRHTWVQGVCSAVRQAGLLRKLHPQMLLLLRVLRVLRLGRHLC